MKIFTIVTTIFLLGTTTLLAAPIDTLHIQGRMLRGPIYTQIAAGYMHYDTITNEDKKLAYQQKAIKYTLLALHYTRAIDSAGQRNCYTNLARVYRSQKKFSQAKWFYLQANTIARYMGDTPNIISTLVNLAAVKCDIKDYPLALADLDHALKLSTKNHLIRSECDVQMGYVLLYNQMNDYTKADAALKRHDFIADSVHKADEIRMLARQKIIEDFENKKKFYTESNIRLYNNLYFKRIVSL